MWFNLKLIQWVKNKQKPSLNTLTLAFKEVKGLVNGFEFFWKWHFCQVLNINLNKIVWKFFLKKIQIFFQEYSRNIFQKVVKKQASVAHVIIFAPYICCIKTKPWL